MKIEKIEIRNLKGKNDVRAAGDINLVVGPNWSGKTTLLTAVRLGLLGYEPSLGKRPGDTMQLATGDSMSVILHMDGGMKIERHWRRKGEKCSLSSEVPDGFKVEAMMIDIDTWFGWTAQERRNFVLSNASVDSFVEKLDNRLLTAIESIKVDDHEDFQAEKKDILDEVQHYMDDRDAEGVPVAGWFALQIERTKERVRESQKIDQQRTALIETIMQERVANPTAMPSDQSERINELNGKIAVLISQKEKNLQVAELAVKKSSAVIELEKLESEGAEQALAEILEQSEKERMKLAGCAVAYKSSVYAELQNQLRTATGDRVSALAQIEILKKGIEEEEAVDLSEACCPTCERKITEKMFARLQFDKKTAISRRKAALEMQEKKRDYVTPIIEDLKKKVAEMFAAAEVHEQFNSAMALLRAKAQPLEFRVERIKYLKNVINDLAWVDAGSIGKDVTAEIESLRNEIGLAQQLQKSRVLTLERNGQEQDALTQRDTARRKVQVQKAAVEVMESMQKEFVSDVFTPLVSRIRKFTTGLLSFEIDHRDGDLGYVGKRGNWISHRTFSGAEKAIVYAGLGVALAGVSSSLSVVMLDELLVADVNKPKVVKRFRELIDERVIDQVFICDTKAWDVQSAVNVINVESV